MTAEERTQSKFLVYQYLPSRYGMNPDDLRKADAIEVVVGQTTPRFTRAAFQLLPISLHLLPIHGSSSMRPDPPGRPARRRPHSPSMQTRCHRSRHVPFLDEAALFGAPIVTEISPLETFWEAEAYHQDYAARNPRQPYVAYTAAPKVEKLRKHFGDRLKRG